MRLPFHIGIVVESLDDGMTGLGDAVGIAWRQPLELAVGPWRLRLVYSREGPPYVELIEAVADSPWAPGAAEAFHHIGAWSADFDGDARAAALVPEFDGRPHGRGFAYYQPRGGGVRIELLDVNGREAFLERWQMVDV